MDELFLPVLSHFRNGNFWSASLGRMNFRVTPGEDTLTAEVWEGPWCYQLSRVEEQTEFPLDEAGLKAVAAWAVRWGETINARPRRSMAETLADREAVLAARREQE